METTIVYWDYIEIMETKVETTMVYWGYWDNGLSLVAGYTLPRKPFQALPRPRLYIIMTAGVSFV